MVEEGREEEMSEKEVTVRGGRKKITEDERKVQLCAVNVVLSPFRDWQNLLLMREYLPSSHFSLPFVVTAGILDIKVAFRCSLTSSYNSFVVIDHIIPNK